jgi:hypothetical protein
VDTFAREHPSRPNPIKFGWLSTMSLSDCVLSGPIWAITLVPTLWGAHPFSSVILSFSSLFSPDSHRHGLTDDLKRGCRHLWHVYQHCTQSIKSQKRLLPRRCGERRRRRLPRHSQLCRLSYHVPLGMLLLASSYICIISVM